MRYKVLFGLVLFLCGAPLVLSAQEVSPFIVETVRESTAPTTTRTGEIFTQVYRLKYVQSEKWGKEVVVLDNDIRPSSFPSPLGDFEIVNWVLSEPVITKSEDTDEIARNLYLSLRIIKPEKKSYTIPKFKIHWGLKVGDNITNQEPFETEEIFVNYVTTITKEPNLDIRDSISFRDYSKEASNFWYVSRYGGGLGTLVLLLLLAQIVRTRKPTKSEQASEKISLEIQADEQDSKPPSFSKTYRAFFKEMRKSHLLLDGSDSDKAQLLSFERRFSVILRNLLVAELGKINPGDTAADIGKYIDKNIKPGLCKENLINLQLTLVDYQTDIESGEPTRLFRNAKDLKYCTVADEMTYLKKSVCLLKRHWRFTEHLRRFGQNLRKG